VVLLGDLATRGQRPALLGDTFDVTTQLDFLSEQRVRALRYSSLSLGKLTSLLAASPLAGASVSLMVIVISPFRAAKSSSSTPFTRRISWSAAGPSAYLVVSIQAMTTRSLETHHSHRDSDHRQTDSCPARPGRPPNAAGPTAARFPRPPPPPGEHGDGQHGQHSQQIYRAKQAVQSCSRAIDDDFWSVDRSYSKQSESGRGVDCVALRSSW
jgi:hypothetical protein